MRSIRVGVPTIFLRALGETDWRQMITTGGFKITHPVAQISPDNMADFEIRVAGNKKISFKTFSSDYIDNWMHQGIADFVCLIFLPPDLHGEQEVRYFSHLKRTSYEEQWSKTDATIVDFPLESIGAEVTHVNCNDFDVFKHYSDERA